MKRLIFLCMMLMCNVTYTEDTSSQSTNSDQSSSQNTATDNASEDVSVAVANVHQINLDNTDIDSGGNWLNKRIWYERSQAIFDDIRRLVTGITDLRIQFSNEVNAVGQKIDSFFGTVIFTKSDIDTKFHEILTALETEQKIVGDLSEEERNLQTSLKQALPGIDQIGKDMKSIGEVDLKIEQTLMQAFKTIDECNDLESKAWDAFKAIAKELDDKKARNFYYQMNNYKQNINQKILYLRSTLLPYLHNVLVAKIEMNIMKINNALEEFKQKGLDLEKIMNKTQEDDAQQIKEREKIAADIAVQKALEIQQEKDQIEQDALHKELEKAKKNSFSNVINAYYEATLGKIVSFFHQLTKLLGLDFVFSYSYPVATTFVHAGSDAKKYMHGIVERIMKNFIPSSQKNVRKNIVQAVEQVSSEHKADQDGKENPAENVQTDTAEKVTTTDVAVETDQHQSDAAPVDEEQKVVVQFLHDTQEKPVMSNGYHVFKSVLDFIGTIIVSLYNCIVQFFKVLVSFFLYISSQN